MKMNPAVLSLTSVRILTAIAVLAGLSIPTSTALQNVSFGLLVVAVMLCGPARAQIGAVLREPFVRGCLVFYAVFVVGVLWAPSMHAAWLMLVKLRPYLFTPVIFAGCMLACVRRGLLTGFGIGALLSAVISLVSAALHHPVMHGLPGDYAVFRTHTYHNSFLSFVILAIAAFWLRGRIAGRYRWLAAVVLAVCAVDAFLFVSGRSAQGVLLATLCALFLLWDVRKGLLGLCVLAVVAIALYSSSHLLKQEVARAQYDLQESHKGLLVEPNGRENSVGLRLYFWRNALAVIRHDPYFGHGTGSYRATILARDGSQGGANPHDDYLWVAVELGAAGVLAMLVMLWGCFAQACKLAAPERWISWLVIASYAMTSLLNSYFTDNITGTGFVLLTAAMLAGPWFNSSPSTVSHSS